MKKYSGRFAFMLFLILGIAMFLRFRGLGETAVGTVLAITYILAAVFFLLSPQKERGSKPMATPKRSLKERK